MTWRKQGRTLLRSDHRTFPLPEGRWVMGQTWLDLLFAHWPVPTSELRRVVPDAVPIDTYEGSAWLGVTPFQVSGARPRGIPALPYLSRFAEVNVRTYATVDGRPGIYFLSLDASSLLAVLGARRTYRLPSSPARMDVRRSDASVCFRSRRVAGDGPSAELDVDYSVTGPARE